MLKVLTIGAATQDIIIEYQEGSQITISTKELPPKLVIEEGSKIEIEQLHYASGGGATNSAVAFKRLGFNVSTFFKVGNDAAGQIIREDIESQKITVHSAVTKNLQTGTSFVIPTSSKDRIIFTYRGANTAIEHKEIPEELFGTQNLLYITSLTNKAADVLPHITHLAQKSIVGPGIKVAVNPGTSQLTKNTGPLKAALRSIDVLIMNSQEMRLFMSSLKPRFFKSSGKGLIASGPELLQTILNHEAISFTLQEYFQEILSYGVKRAVVTDGKNGVYIGTKDLIYFHPAIQTKVVNTLGAGDAFGSCFVAHLAQGKKIENAIRCGILNASSVIMHHDAKTGLLSELELQQYLANFDTNLLQNFAREK